MLLVLGIAPGQSTRGRDIDCLQHSPSGIPTTGILNQESTQNETMPSY